MDAAASSGVPPLCSGMADPPPPPVAWDFPPGIPRATFLPSISIAAPASFACVNLHSIVKSEIPSKVEEYEYLPCLDKTESDGVSSYAKDTPLFASGFRQTNNCRLRSCVICLADIPMEA